MRLIIEFSFRSIIDSMPYAIAAFEVLKLINVKTSYDNN